MRARTLAAGGTVLTLLGAAPAAAQMPPTVFPQLCVVYEPGASEMTARLSYVNTSSTPVTIFRGAENLFVEPPQNRQQPEVFQPGYHPHVFETTFDPAVGLRYLLRAQLAVVAADPRMACKQDLGVLAAPTVSGLPRAGEMLATDGGWFGGDPAPDLAYQWQRSTPDGEWEDIADATSFAYWAVPADAGRRLRVRVTASNHQGTVESRSAPTEPVAPPPVLYPGTGAPDPPPAEAPTAIGAPAVTGDPRVGATLTATLGEWSGTPAPALAAQWQRCAGDDCRDVPGATAAAYNVATADTGHTLRVRVAATNAGGRASAVSSPTTTVTAPPRLTLVDTPTTVHATGHGRRAAAGLAVAVEHAAQVELRVTSLRGRRLRLRPGSAFGDQRAAEPARRLAVTPTEGTPIAARVVLDRRRLRRAGGGALLRLRATGAGGEDTAVVAVVARRR